jgi:phage-related protein
MAGIIAQSEKMAIDGYDLSQLNLYIGSTGSGMTKGIGVLNNSLITKRALQRDGSYFFSANKNPRVMNINMYFHEATQQNIQDMMGRLNFKTLKKIVFDGQADRYIYAVPEGQGIFNFTEWEADDTDYYSGSFVYKLFCPDPYFRSLIDGGDGIPYEEKRLTMTSTYPYPFKYNQLFRYVEKYGTADYTSITINTDFTLTNFGNADAYTAIRLTGDCTNLTITNNSTNKSFDITSMSSEDVVIDSEKGLITDLAGSILKTSLFSGSFINLQSGDNSMTISADSMNISVMNWSWRHTYY